MNNNKLSNLFSGNDKVYNIPRFQRNYVWDYKNWEQLFGDINYLINQKNWNHFIGSLVFLKENDDVFVIDGQQRMITIQMLSSAILCTLNDLLLKTDNIEEKYKINNARDIIVNFITITDIKKGKVPRLNVDYDEAFSEIINDVINQNKVSDSKSKVFNCYYFFYNLIKEYDFKKILELYSSISNIEYVDVEIKSEENAFRVYETLNARGTQLLQIELVKNYLFYYLKPKNHYDKYKKQWHKFENNFENIKPDDYLFHIYKCFFVKNIKIKQLYEELKINLDGNPDKVEEFFNNLIGLQNLYKKVVECEYDDSKINFALKYFKIKNFKQPRSLLLALAVKNKDNVIDDKDFYLLIKLLRNFFVAFNLQHAMANSIDKDIHDLSFEIIKLTNKNKIKSLIYSFILKNKTVFDDINLADLRFSNKKKDSNIQSGTLIYLFEMLFEKDILSYEYIENYNKWSIEHVLNDSFENAEDGFIGNLFPCTKTLNNSFGSEDYTHKRMKYIDCQYKWVNEFGNRYGKFDFENIKTRTEELSKKLKSIVKPNFESLNNFVINYSKK